MGLFFIRRPVFAWVLALTTMLAGAWSFVSLPVAQYPDIAPTAVRVSATYSGATAEAVENSVTRVIEDAMTGLEGMIYMTARSSQGAAWTGISYQERQSGDQAPWLYAISAFVIFLALAALYESWSIPFSVMLAVPVRVLRALLTAWVCGQSNDVYFKVGMLTTIGLAARNAILIVEIAEDLRAQGRSIAEAAIEAARLRLRPILMTASTFILGVLPLATASGAGAAAQNATGTGVIGGMVASTFTGIFMVPALYALIMRLVRWAEERVTSR